MFFSLYIFYFILYSRGEFFMCGMTCACIIGITISGFIALIIAGLFLTGVFTGITTGLFIALAISVIAIFFLIISLSNCNSCSIDCFRTNGICLLIGAIGTIISSIIALSVTLTAGSLLGAVLIGIVAFFFTLTISSIISLIICLLNIEDNNNSDNVNGRGGNNRTNGSCRCNR